MSRLCKNVNPIKMKNFTTICLFFLACHLSGQVSINTTGSPPVATAMLDISGSGKGILIPRMTASDRDLISNPAQSLLIFNTTSNCYNYWTGTAWIALAAGNIKELADGDSDTKVQVEKIQMKIQSGLQSPVHRLHYWTPDHFN